MVTWLCSKNVFGKDIYSKDAYGKKYLEAVSVTCLQRASKYWNQGLPLLSYSLIMG